MRETRVLNNEKGLAKFILVVGLLALGVYVGLQFGMPYYRYSAFKSDVVELARISLGDVATLLSIVTEDPPRLDGVVPHVSRSLSAVLVLALSSK